MKNKLDFFIICMVLLWTSCKSQPNSNLTSKNLLIAKSFIEYLNLHDANKLTSLFADQCLYEEVASGRSYNSRDKIAYYISATIAGIPDTKFDVINMVANDSIAVIEWLWKGTNSVGWDNMGLPATNKYFELKGTSVMVIKNGLITRNSDYWDWNSFIIGIGIKPK